LSKQYLIGAQEPGYRTLREALISALTAPIARLRSVQGSKAAKDIVWALNNVSFHVRPGEIVGIIGRNGAGKSTLLKILSRITLPSNGQVSVRGRVASLLEVGTGFHPELTGRENIFLNGTILGMTRREIREKFDEIVDFADVERFIDMPVKHYSSGMYTRLAFAVAAHLETDILLVDEVLAVGDASFQQKCLAKMQDVAGRGRTVLFVSHNMTAVQSLCERVIHLAEGQVKGDGECRGEIQNYLLSATIRQTNRQRRLKLGDGLTLTGMSFSPNPVESRTDFHFQLVLLANCPVRLSEVVLILYALEGPCVGTVNLSSAGLPCHMKAGEHWRIEGVIQSIPLVERQYRISVWINSGAFVGEVADLADLTVSPAMTSDVPTRAPSQYRGWVEFKTQYSAQLYRDRSLIATTG
jgi:lipopolysaccharide transport system ATP-binding protein